MTLLNPSNNIYEDIYVYTYQHVLFGIFCDKFSAVLLSSFLARDSMGLCLARCVRDLPVRLSVCLRVRHTGGLAETVEIRIMHFSSYGMQPRQLYRLVYKEICSYFI